MSNELVRFLEWDSDFFGIRIARIIRDSVTEAQLLEINEWCEKEKIECAYFLADPSSASSLEAAINSGFATIDTRIVLDLPLPIDSKQLRDQEFYVRKAISSDIPELKRIASVSHRESRFYADRNFNTDLCDKLFATWIENSCSGYADAVYVAEHSNKPVGYITCNMSADRQGEIGLFGVAEPFRSKGVGATLMGNCIAWFIDNEARTVKVATQERNNQAVSFYKKFGFEASSRAIWLHRWFRK